MIHCFIIPRIPTTPFLYRLANLVFSSELTLLIFLALYDILVCHFFCMLSGVFSAPTWFLNNSLAVVSQGPVHQILLFSFRPRDPWAWVSWKKHSHTLFIWDFYLILGLFMFIELCKISKLVMHQNSCSMDLGHDISWLKQSREWPVKLSAWMFLSVPFHIPLLILYKLSLPTKL